MKHGRLNEEQRNWKKADFNKLLFFKDESNECVLQLMKFKHQNSSLYDYLTCF